ncbi:MAG: hypothetical protein DWI48_03045 [Chloroflexi bacterium]|nr:MAG: hypothetical protein DWI48_03045 [Chloroflexota bacterium]
MSRRVLFTVAVLLCAAVLGVACANVSLRGAATATPVVGGENVALVIDHTVYVQRIDGTRRAIATVAGQIVYPLFPRWSPDGQLVAYVERHFFSGQAGADWGDDVYVVPVRGGTPTLVRKHGSIGQQVEGFAWTPDGKALLIGDVRVGGDGSPFAPSSSRLVRYDLNAKTETVIVESALDPSISADGTRIAYLASSGDKLALMTANADGSAARELVPADAFVVLRFPRISPDGKAVLFSAPDAVGARLAPTGSQGWLDRVLHELTPGRAEAHGLPAYVWAVEISTGARRKVTPQPDDDPCAAWLDGGQMVAVLSSTGLYRALPSGGAVQRIEEGALGGQVDAR